LIVPTDSLSISYAITHIDFGSAWCPAAGTEIFIMSADQVQHPLITCHDVEHPHAIGRRVKAGLTFVGVAAAGVFALILTSPTPTLVVGDLFSSR
jgi:hypothetical protein